MPEINCATGLLVPYVPNGQNQWTDKKAQHLYRRLTLGADITTIQNSLNLDPVDLTNQIISDAVNLPLASEPQWAYWMLSDYDPDPDVRNEQIVSQIFDWGGKWMLDLASNGLRDRLSWYWHNHFVTKLDDYGCPSWMYQYHQLLQKYALGNFKEFTREMGKTPAMLVYLNGVQNTRLDPNENFARELFELFTLGVNNGYTQADIVDAARAFTGFNGIDINDLCGPIDFVPALWDPNSKTIFGQTGNWNYDQVIDILFEERGELIAKYICTKLYRDFVNPIENPEIVDQLAATFLSNNFELEPVFRQLFTSEHFFDDAHLGTIIPGHIEYFMTFINEVGYPKDETLLLYVGYSADDFNQRIFNPTDVSGWPGNRSWINSSSLPYRWSSITDIMNYFFVQKNNSLPHLLNLAQSLTSMDEGDPELVVRKIIDYIMPNGLQFDQDYEEAIVVFKADVPQNYFDNGLWNMQWEYASAQVYYLMSHLANIPEFQLK